MTTNGTQSANSWYVRQLGRMFAASTAVLAGIMIWHWYRDDAARQAARTEVGALLAAQERAWNAGDLDGFMEGYRMSDDITFYSEGTVQSGWLGLRERYDRKYRADGKSMGFLSFSELYYDVLSVDAVIVRGRWGVRNIDRSSHGLFTILLRKDPEGWRVVHDHTSAAPEKN